MRPVPITVIRTGDQDVVRPRGVLDLASSPRLRALLGAICGQTGRHVVVDLSGVEVIDASAIGVLMFARDRAERAGGTLRAVQPNPLVLKLLQITGVAKALDSDPPPTEAAPGAHRRTAADGHATETLLQVLSGLPAGAPERPLLRELVVELTTPFAVSLARRFRNRGQSADDLDQVAMVGLLKAVDRYDPGIGCDFLAYAAPTILGELRRHFRDKGWYIQVPRRLQELRLTIRAAQPDLTQQLARSPTVEDLADHLGVDQFDILAALEATRAYAPYSLDQPVADSDALTLSDLIGSLDPEFDGVENRELLAAAMAQLTPREQRILTLRFYGNLTQAEIGQRLSISQMHVSRLLSRALRTLRRYLEDSGVTEAR